MVAKLQSLIFPKNKQAHTQTLAWLFIYLQANNSAAVWRLRKKFILDALTNSLSHLVVLSFEFNHLPVVIKISSTVYFSVSLQLAELGLWAKEPEKSDFEMSHFGREKETKSIVSPHRPVG